MKQTINISLAGIAFSVETDGYNKLKEYLLSIEREYNNPIEAAELTSDIETRIAELILNRQTSSTPVTEETIDSIIAQMGFPIDEEQSKESKIFSSAEESSQRATPPPYEENRKIAHRLYRNSDGAMMGGVCSGLSAYFNLDVVIIRLLFFAPLIVSLFTTLFFTTGFFWSLNLSTFILYLILWIVIPKARTPRQILEMQGEPVTKENMERFLKDEIIDVDSNISRITRSEKSATLLSSLIYIFGRILKFFLYFIGSMFILGICGSILIGIGHVIYGSVACHTFFENLFSGNIYVNIAVAMTICIIPLIVFLMMLIRPIFKVYPRKSFYITLAIIWLLSIVYGSVIGIETYLRFSQNDYFEETIDMPISGNTLFIKRLNPEMRYSGSYKLEYLGADMVLHRSIYVNECKNHTVEDNTVKIRLRKKGYGRTNKDAYENAQKVPVDYRIEGDTLFINNHYKVNSPNELFNESSVHIHKPSHIYHLNEMNQRGR